jgi:iron complex outermembrane receptor protein
MKKVFLSLILLTSFLNLFAQTDTTEVDLWGLSIEELMNVQVVTASKKAESLSDAPSIISAVTQQDIEKMGVTSLIDVLKYIPAIETSMGPDGHYRVSIRGERKVGNILVLINGHHINDFYDGRSIFDFPVNFIDRIEVIRGPGSAIYGTNAVAGVINIITLKEAKSVKITAGTNGTYGADLAFSKGDEKKGFTILGGYNQTNGANVQAYSPPDDTLYSDETNRWLKDAYIQSSFKYNNLNASIFGIYRTQGPWVGPVYVLAPDSKFNTGQLLGDISYNLKIAKNFNIVPKVYVDYINHDFTTQEQPDGYKETFTDGAIFKEKYKGLCLGSEIQADYTINDNIDFLTGIVYESLSMQDYDFQRNYKSTGSIYMGDFDNYDNVKMEQKDKTREVFAYYLQGNFNWKKIAVTTGFRYDNYSDFGNSFNPRLGIVYKVFKNLNIKALYGQAFRAPTFKELYDLTNAIDKNGVYGNDTLNPETRKSSEIGIEFKNSKFIARTNLFYNLSKNIINVYDPYGTGAVGRYQNLGNTKNYGIEFESILYLSKKINFFVNVSNFNTFFNWNENDYFKNEIKYMHESENADSLMRNIPMFRLNTGLNLMFKKIQFFAGVNYGGISSGNKRNSMESDRFVEIPSYLQANFNITYLVNKDFRISISGNNIGKIKYSDPEESTNIRKLGLNGMGQPTSTFILSLNYRF